MNSILGYVPMLPQTLGVLVYSLFMRVDYSVCVTLPLIILYLLLNPAQSVVCALIHNVMVMELVNIFTQPRHPLGKYK